MGLEKGKEKEVFARLNTTAFILLFKANAQDPKEKPERSRFSFLLDLDRGRGRGSGRDSLKDGP
jgi:hypothetical protein